MQETTTTYFKNKSQQHLCVVQTVESFVFNTVVSSSRDKGFFFLNSSRGSWLWCLKKTPPPLPPNKHRNQCRKLTRPIYIPGTQCLLSQQCIITGQTWNNHPPPPQDESYTKRGKSKLCNTPSGWESNSRAGLIYMQSRFLWQWVSFPLLPSTYDNPMQQSFSIYTGESTKHLAEKNKPKEINTIVFNGKHQKVKQEKYFSVIWMGPSDVCL